MDKTHNDCEHLASDIESAVRKYGIAPEIHTAAMKALDAHKRAISSENVCRLKPEFGVPGRGCADGVPGESVTQNEMRCIDKKNKNYDEQRVYNMSKVRENSFFFVHIGNCKVGYKKPLVQIYPATFARLSLLACHLAYNSSLLMNACRGGRRMMTLKEIKKTLKLPRATFSRFWKAVHAEKPADGKYIIGKDETGYYLTIHAETSCEGKTMDQSMVLFQYGTLERAHSVRVQKMDINTLRDLYHHGMVVKPDGSYRKVVPTDHCAIGRVLLLIPYLHEQENVLCWNPYEKRSECIMPLTSVDIAKILNVDVDHISREINKMLSIAIPVEMESVIEVNYANDQAENAPIKKDMHLFSRYKTEDRTVYYINPALVYFGSAERYKQLLQSEWLYVKIKKENGA